MEMSLLVKWLLLAEYALVVAVCPLIILFYIPETIRSYAEKRDGGFWLSLGIVLAWGGEALIRSYWMVWRVLDEPAVMVWSPAIPIFFAVKAIGACCHAFAPLRYSGKGLRNFFLALTFAVWIALLLTTGLTSTFFVVAE